VPLVYYSAFLDDKPSFNKNEKNTSSSNLNKKAIVDNAINQDNLLKKDIAPKSNSSALSYNNSGKANKSKISALSNNASKNENITSTDIISITAFNDEDNLFANNSASTLSKSSIFVSKELNIDQNNPEIRFINSRYINEPINRDWQFSIRYLAGANPAVQGFANNTGSILPINNIAIGAIMGAGSNFNILLEFGQEDFLRYSSDETDMLTLKERSAFWVATGLRYDLNSLSAAGIKPYGQLNLGASTEGFIIRGSAGMQFHDDDLKVMGLSPAIIIGYELTELIYKAPDNTYYAPYKHGLTLGLNFHF
jgi:hypothetical protein